MSVFKEVGNNRKYTDSYILYKKKDNQEIEERDTTPYEYTFRACDFEDYNEEEVQDGIVSIRIIKHLTIETPSRLNFQIGDQLKSVKDGMMWRVKKFIIKDNNKCKDKSLRPKKLTILELVG